MTQRRVFLALMGFLGGALVLLAALFVMLPTAQNIARPSSVGGPFQLVNQDGGSVTEETYEGAPFLVFFGFTHCPDICPTTLFEMSQIFDALGQDAGKAAALFITVDPERDTPEAMKSYIASFHPSIRGLTGTPEQVAAAIKTYRAYAKKVPTEGGDYTMDHSAVVYLMDKQGNFIAPFNIKRPPAEAAAELRQYF